MYGYAYKTTNLANNKIYIGQKQGEFNSSYFGSGLLIQRAISKYGEENFKTKILAYGLTKHELDELEKTFIAKYRKLLGERNVYNISDGGQGGRIWKTPPSLGVPMPEKTKEKIGLANKGKIRSRSARMNYRIARLGKPSPMTGKEHSKNTLQKMINNHQDFSGAGNPMYGKVHSNETKLKMKESAKLGWLKRRFK
jgi:group I intron endonuclease